MLIEIVSGRDRGGLGRDLRPAACSTNYTTEMRGAATVVRAGAVRGRDGRRGDRRAHTAYSREITVPGGIVPAPRTGSGPPAPRRACHHRMVSRPLVEIAEAAGADRRPSGERDHIYPFRYGWPPVLGADT